MRNLFIIAAVLMLFSCTKKEEKLDLDAGKKIYSVTFSQTFEKSVTVMPQAAGSVEKNTSLSGKEIQIYQLQSGNYVHYKTIQVFEHSGNGKPNENTKIDLPEGDYMLNLFAYKSFIDDWLGKKSYLVRNYNWFWNDKRIPNDIYMNKVATLNVRTSDVFMAQKKFSVKGEVSVNVVAKRVTGKLKFVSTSPIPAEANRIEIKINGSRAIKMDTKETFFDGEYKYLLLPVYYRYAPDDFGYSFHLLPGKTKVEVITSTRKGDLVSKVTIPNISVEAGKMITLKGDFFPTNGISVTIDDPDYTNTDITF